MAELFRKTALDTMSTPEQLDKQVKIMRPSVWIIFIAMVTALVTFFIWSFTYHITNGVNLSGVVFTNNDIITHTANHDCVVTDVLVHESDHVEIGDIIAVVSNHELLEKIEKSRLELSMAKKGSDVYKTLSNQIDKLTDRYIASTIIKSSTSGNVQSVKASGTALSVGDSICTIMTDRGYNEVTAYVPMQTARNLNLGMMAQVSPSYAPREEYGYMTGVITAISDTPVSEESIISRMGNLSYVDGIIPEGSCVEVRIRLDVDENSANSYKWSNRKGENLSVELGTQCSVIVVTNEYLPIEVLIG